MTFDEYLDIIVHGHMADLVSAASPEAQGLLTQACNIFERFAHSDQCLVLACMMGMIMGTLEGEHVPAEATFGVMITHEHRLRQFHAQALCVFWDAMEARGVTLPREPPACLCAQRSTPPKKAKVVKQKGARVIQMASGKRKRMKP